MLLILFNKKVMKEMFCYTTIYILCLMLPKIQNSCCRNPTLKDCEDDTHAPEMGTWESFGTLENLELDCRGQKTLP